MSGSTEATITEIDLPEADRSFWERHHAFRRVRHAESTPDDPLAPDEMVEAQMSYRDPFIDKRAWEAVISGITVGFTGVTGPSSVDPTYESNRRFVHFELSVHHDHRRRGIGKELLRLALADTGRRGGEVLGTRTHEPSGHAFLEGMGAEVRQVDRTNRLLLADVDWPMIDRWIAEGIERNSKTVMRFIRGALPDELVVEACDLLEEIDNMVPFDDIDHGERRVTPEMLRHWEERIRRAGAEFTTAVTQESDGGLSAITWMRWHHSNPWISGQGLTGVRKRHQGRGLGKWLKAAMLRRMAQEHPELREVVTGNANSNAPMLSINDGMGFKLFRESKSYQVDRTRVEAFLALPPP